MLTSATIVTLTSHSGILLWLRELHPTSEDLRRVRLTHRVQAWIHDGCVFLDAVVNLRHSQSFV